MNIVGGYELSTVDSASEVDVYSNIIISDLYMWCYL